METVAMEIGKLSQGMFLGYVNYQMVLGDMYKPAKQQMHGIEASHAMKLVIWLVGCNPNTSGCAGSGDGFPLG